MVRKADAVSPDDLDLTPIENGAAAPKIDPGRRTLTSRLARRARGDGAMTDGADSAVSRASGSSGSPLPDELRGRFEGSLGSDLSSVRVHTGSESVQASAAVGAQAYTVGNDIHFGDGQYRPDDPYGQHLLAHEVAHTQQQAAGTPTRQNRLEVSEPGDSLEVEADRAADAMVAGRPVDIAGSTGPQVARKAAGSSHPMVRVGSTGPAVQELQQKLSIPADGMFGPQTRAAVVKFQQSKGLTPDGIVGPMTWGALDGQETPQPGGGQPGQQPGGGAAPQPAGPPVDVAPPTPAQPTGGQPGQTGQGGDADKLAQAHTSEGDDAAGEGGGDTGEKTAGQKYREAFLEQLRYYEGSYEHGPGQDKFQSIMPTSALNSAREAATAQGRTFTTCNTFAGIAMSLAEQKSGVKLKTKINLHVMDPKWREKNLPPGCFHKGGAGTGERPRAGDVMILSKDGASFSHMSNLVEDPQPQDDGTEIWQGVDGGQGQANVNEAVLRVTYVYDPATGKATNKGSQRPPRYVYGWIDLEVLANASV